MRFLLLLALLGALPSLALEPIRVSDSVYFVRGEAGVPSVANRGHTSNAGFVVTREGVVVFDTLGTPVLGKELIEAIRRITPSGVKSPMASRAFSNRAR